MKPTKIHLGGVGDDQILGGSDTNDIIVDWGSSPSPLGFNTIKDMGGDNLVIAFGNNNVYLGNGNNQLFFLGDTINTNFAELGTGNNRVQGGDGTDIITVGVHKLGYSYLLQHEDGSLTLEWAEYNDPLSGGNTNGVNFVDGGAGNDSLMGNAGRDTLLGGLGNDYVGGGHNDDRLLGGAGDDVLDGGLGHDIVDGGTGSDMFFVSNDTVHLGYDTDVDIVYVNPGLEGLVGVTVVNDIQSGDVLRLYWWQQAQIGDDVIVVTDIYSGAQEFLVGEGVEDMQIQVIGMPIDDFGLKG